MTKKRAIHALKTGVKPMKIMVSSTRGEGFGRTMETAGKRKRTASKAEQMVSKNTHTNLMRFFRPDQNGSHEQDDRSID